MAKATPVAAVEKEVTSQLLAALAERTYNNDWDKMATQFNKVNGTSLKSATLKRYASGYTDGTRLPAYMTSAALNLMSKKLRVA